MTTSWRELVVIRCFEDDYPNNGTFEYDSAEEYFAESAFPELALKYKVGFAFEAAANSANSADPSIMAWEAETTSWQEVMEEASEIVPILEAQLSSSTRHFFSIITLWQVYNYRIPAYWEFPEESENGWEFLCVIDLDKLELPPKTPKNNG